MKVIIILAAYNGERYIQEQIKSIQGQTVKDWTLLIRDDGSKDDTVDKVRSLIETDNRITLLQDGLGNLGVTQNFARLMQVSLDIEADYVAISDQDDVWHSEKLQLLLDEMKQLEGKKITPILIHSDLEVVDAEMRMVSHSFMEYTGIKPKMLNVGHLICQNDVTGCACLINSALLKIALPIPLEVPIHDWWLALMAVSCGKIGYVDRALVKYRQHRGNVVGAKPSFGRMVIDSLKPAKWLLKIKGVRASIAQAGKLLDRHSNNGLISQKNGANEVAHAYSQILNIPRLQRLQILKANNIHKRSTVADLTFKLIVIVIPLNIVNRQ